MEVIQERYSRAGNVCEVHHMKALIHREKIFWINKNMRYFSQARVMSTVFYTLYLTYLLNTNHRQWQYIVTMHSVEKRDSLL